MDFINSLTDDTLNSKIFESLYKRDLEMFMKEENYTQTQLESFISFPMVSSNNRSIIFDYTSTTYKRIDGLKIDREGNVDLFLIKGTKDSSLFDNSDVEFVLKNGVSNSSFSLDKYSLKFPNIFKFRYFPTCLKGTNFLQTLAYTDYILKNLIHGFTLDDKFPFISGKSNSNLLPKYLQDLLYTSYNNSEKFVHRIWIEPTNIVINVQYDNDSRKYFFSDFKLRVNCARLEGDWDENYNKTINYCN